MSRDVPDDQNVLHDGALDGPLPERVEREFWAARLVAYLVGA